MDTKDVIKELKELGVNDHRSDNPFRYLCHTTDIRFIHDVKIGFKFKYEKRPKKFYYWCDGTWTPIPENLSIATMIVLYK